MMYLGFFDALYSLIISFKHHTELRSCESGSKHEVAIITFQDGIIIVCDILSFEHELGVLSISQRRGECEDKCEVFTSTALFHR